MFWCEVPLDFHPRHQAWRINALGHPSRLKAVLDLTGYVVVSNIYLVLHPRSVANEIPTKTTYLTQQTAGDLVGWLLTNHQPAKKRDVVSGSVNLHFFCILIVWTRWKQGSFLDGWSCSGGICFLQLVSIYKWVSQILQFHGCYINLNNYIDKLPNRPWPMRFLGSWIFQGESRVILM